MEESRISTKRILGYFWAHTRKFRWLALFSVMGAFAAVLVGVIRPLLFKEFFDVLAYGNTAVASALVHIIVVVLLLSVLEWVGWRVGSLASNRLQTNVMKVVRLEAYEKLLGHSYSFFSNTFGGKLIRRINRLPRAYEILADQVLYSFMPLVITTAGILYVLFTRSRLLGLILLAWTVMFLAAQYAFILWKQRYELEQTEKDSKASGVLADGITNSTTIREFSGRRHESALFRDALEALRRISFFTWNLNELMRAVQAALMFIAQFVMFYYAIIFWQQGVLTIGDFALIQAYLITLFAQVWGFGNVLRNVYRAFAEAGEALEVMDEPYEIQDQRGASKITVSEGRVVFDNVVFSFNQTRKILSDFSLTIQPGERVALVGPSGAGKTTVVKLLSRLHDVDGGKITIDGQDISHVTQESLRDNIALVPQDPILFHRTLMENIRYGRRDASDEEVVHAAKQAHCHEFITELQDGYETYVGERGVKLSGGERQRVAIARAILKDAPILVLDEATSSLDSESEALIQDALSKLMEGRTTIVIAHRLSTIMKMDRIIVISNGKVETIGTHNELVAKEGIYKKLWEIQAGGFIQD